MPKFAEKWTHEQREAMGIAYVDRGMRPARLVVEAARAGDLEYNGKRLDPFDPPLATVRDNVRHLKRRRAGQVESELATRPPRDAIEALRRRLVSLADRELAAIERDKAGTADLERLRQVIRCVKEAAALPGPKDPRPRQPGEGASKDREGSPTTSGLGAQMLQAAKMNVHAPRPSSAGVAR